MEMAQFSKKRLRTEHMVLVHIGWGLPKPRFTVGKESEYMIYLFLRLGTQPLPSGFPVFGQGPTNIGVVTLTLPRCFA